MKSIIKNMQSKSKKVRAPFIASGAVTLAVCCVWFGYLAYLDYKEQQWIKYTQPIYFDYDFTDVFPNQSLGSCTHDLSYTEPVIPEGKYYPDGNGSREYYVEVTRENGKQYFEYKMTDGTPCIADESSPFARINGKHEFVVYTDHQREMIFVSNRWQPIKREDYPDPDMWPGAKINITTLDRDQVMFRVFFDESGSTEMDIVTSGELTREDIEKGYRMKQPL